MGNKVTFDPVTKIIQIDEAPVGGEVDIDVQIDLYSDGKEDWVSTAELIKSPFPIRAIGGDPLPGAKYLGATFFLDPAWKIRPYEANHILIVVGNLYTEDGSSPFVNTSGSYNVRIQSEVSALVYALEGGGGITEQDKLDIADRVLDEDLSQHGLPKSTAIALRSGVYRIGTITYDSVNGVPGTGYPIGTTYYPSSNFTDTLLIMLYGRTNDLVLRSDLVVNAGHDISNKVIRTIGLMGTNVTLTAGCDADKASFRNVNLTGEINGGDEILVYDCSIGDFVNFKGIMNNVSFLQGAEISLDTWATIIQGTCGGDPTNEVEINIGTASLNMTHWAGNLKLTGKTGSNRTVINCDSGNIIIDSTCVAGIIQILGDGTIEADNSGVGCIVDIDGFSSVDNIVDVIEERLTIGNMAIQPMAATEIDPVRNVRIGDLDRVVYKWKTNTDTDWDSPRKVVTQYAWYQTPGDNQPIMKEDG